MPSFAIPSWADQSLEVRERGGWIGRSGIATRFVHYLSSGGPGLDP